jgi:transcriptional regulator with XRE-family HTH domain
MADLRKLREGLKLTQAQLARLVGTSQPQIRRLEAGERKMTKEWAKRLAPHLQMSAKDLMFDPAEGTPPQQVEVEGLPVLGTSRAGGWLDITLVESDEHEHETIPVAKNPRFPRARQYALLISGDSMNLMFKEGAYVTCVDFADSGLDIKPGMVVHVERTLAGPQLMETTVKKVGNGELLPMSDNPIHKPIPINGGPDTEITVKGVVIGKWEPISFDGLES